MNNNDILRRLRYTFDYSDSQMIDIFGLAGVRVSREEVSNWLKREEDEAFEKIKDVSLASFLNGFIIRHRGKREGPQPEPERQLSNNQILRKVKIALQLKDTDMVDIMKIAGTKVSKHEISAFFRKPSQSQYRDCLDQFLRNFFQGLQAKYKPKV
jgi:uncharacterized protein YehS (DUF1456 family)